MDPDALVEPLRADVTSGAAEVAGEAARLLAEHAERAPARTAGGLRAALGTLAVAVLDGQPAMAPLVSLCREVLGALDALEETATLEEARRAAAAAAAGFAASIGPRTAAVAARIAELLPAEGPVLTLSRSSTVEAALLEAGRRRPLEVVCLESRPMKEGRALAAALAEGGLGVTVAVDAALEALLPRCAAVVLGADSVGDAGVVNKVGSAAAAELAARQGIPVLVAADASKLLPPGFPQPLGARRPAAEVWEAPTGIRVWNRYFSRVPLHRVALVVTEDDALSPDDVAGKRQGLAVPPPLDAWAARRSAPGE